MFLAPLALIGKKKEKVSRVSADQLKQIAGYIKVSKNALKDFEVGTKKFMLQSKRQSK